MQGVDLEPSEVNRPKQARAWKYPLDPARRDGTTPVDQSAQDISRLHQRKGKENLHSEDLFNNAKSKGPTTNKLMLMPTEASNVPPLNHAPTKENYVKPQAM
ncbi:hypothetical protein YC2023_033607 [Brassica napus]